MDRETLFRKAINENKQRIYRICSFYFPDPDDRNDAYQDSLIKIWDNLSSFQSNSLISTWIYRVVVNTCLGCIRKEKRRQKKLDALDRLENVMHPFVEDQDVHRQTDEKLLFFKDFIYRLTASDRTLVSLYLEELSTREMAEITGLSEANVRVRIFRIKEQVKKEWEEKNHGTG